MIKARWMILILCAAGIAGALLWHMNGEKVEYAQSAAFEHGSVRIVVTSAEAAEMLNEHELRITVTDTEGAPAEASDLHVSLSMPSMLCGSFPAAITHDGPGRYAAVAIPVMRGAWEADIRFGSASSPVRIAYPFHVK